MNFHETFFILLAAIIMIFSVLVVTTDKILRAATYLLFVLLATAGLYYWLQYEFMAAVQVALYAGGIVVLIVFSVLLTHQIHHKLVSITLTRKLLAFGIAGLGALVSIVTIVNYDFNTAPAEAMKVDVRQIGLHLVNTGHNGFALPFEVVSILLLAALIGAITIAKKEESNSDNI